MKKTYIISISAVVVIICTVLLLVFGDKKITRKSYSR